MNKDRTLRDVEIPDGVEPGTMIFAIRFMGEKQSMHGKGFVRIQEIMDWAEEVWTDMDSRLMFDSKMMIGVIYATVNNEEKEVAAIHAMIPQHDNSEFNPVEV